MKKNIITYESVLSSADPYYLKNKIFSSVIKNMSYESHIHLQLNNLNNNDIIELSNFIRSIYLFDVKYISKGIKYLIQINEIIELPWLKSDFYKILDYLYKTHNVISKQKSNIMNYYEVKIIEEHLTAIEFCFYDICIEEKKIYNSSVGRKIFPKINFTNEFVFSDLFDFYKYNINSKKAINIIKKCSKKCQLDFILRHSGLFGPFDFCYLKKLCENDYKMMSILDNFICKNKLKTEDIYS